ncbi:MAG: glycine--tRNA ligase, partial [Candidatus Eremiobacteraeota bacterium]|nr:glycine--tRNA ligase [Candidatus Eremiobacteraeota bacterium]
VDCRNCKHRFRADHIPSLGKCPDCGMTGTLTESRNFNLMMKTAIGPMEDTSAQTYLRPETAQGIFVNFKNIYQTARKRPPFGIAQIGKSFRNEITPGNFTFRVREFEQAELEYFVPDDGTDLAWYDRWVTARKQWYSDYGVRPERLRFYELPAAERPHYARAGTDVEYLFPWGWGELESIAHRGTYDLDAHMRLSGKDLTFFDEATKSKYTPILIESSAGMDRTTLTMLIDAYGVEEIADGEKTSKRTVLRFHPKIAPVQVGVFPLARNKPDLVERAHSIERALRPAFRTQYDEGNVGQLYRRQDEIGTPYCIMVDYETLNDTTITVRDRDTMQQARVSQDALASYLRERL